MKPKRLVFLLFSILALLSLPILLCMLCVSCEMIDNQYDYSFKPDFSAADARLISLADRILQNPAPLQTPLNKTVIPDTRKSTLCQRDIGSITFSFVGDCMLASFMGEYTERSFNSYADQYEPEYFFAGVYDIFSKDDYTVANCENIFTDNDELLPVAKNHSPAYWYKSPIKNAGIFTAGSVEIASVANNHTLDYGTDGFADTIYALEKAGVLWGDDDHTLYLEKYGFTVALSCISVGTTGKIDKILSQLPEIQENSDFQIVYFHGGIERVHTANGRIRDMAHRLADAGADLVIGHHPHVLQPIEVYNGVTIVHSLGNFVFGAGGGENRTIIYQYTLYVSGNDLLGTDQTIIPCYSYVNRFQPAIITEEEKIQRVLDFLNGSADNPL